MKYGFATCEDSERWANGQESIQATIVEAIDTLHGGDHEPVAICEVSEPDINYMWLVNTVLERASEQLYEEVGEVAETFEVDDEQKEELAALLRDWIAKHGLISCWKADNGRMYAPGDAEYDAAIASLSQKAGEQQ
jgi:hypothetical protein